MNSVIHDLDNNTLLDNKLLNVLKFSYRLKEHEDSFNEQDNNVHNTFRLARKSPFEIISPSIRLYLAVFSENEISYLIQEYLGYKFEHLLFIDKDYVIDTENLKNIRKISSSIDINNDLELSKQYKKQLEEDLSKLAAKKQLLELELIEINKFLISNNDNNTYSKLIKFDYLSNHLQLVKDINQTINATSSTRKISSASALRIDYLTKLKILKDTTILKLTTKTNEIINETNIRESLQLKLNQSVLSLFQTIPYDNNNNNNNVNYGFNNEYFNHYSYVQEHEDIISNTSKIFSNNNNNSIIKTNIKSIFNNNNSIDNNEDKIKKFELKLKNIIEKIPTKDFFNKRNTEISNNLINKDQIDINKDLLEDRKIHKSILSMHCNEVLNEFHSELEIKMSNCLSLCKHAIYLRTGSLDNIKNSEAFQRVVDIVLNRIAHLELHLEAFKSHQEKLREHILQDFEKKIQISSTFLMQQRITFLNKLKDKLTSLHKSNQERLKYNRINSLLKDNISYDYVL